MLRFSLALLALSALGACAAAGGHETGALGGSSRDRADRSAQAERIPPESAAARAAIGREDMLTQMTFWAQEYEKYPRDLDAARNFAETLRKGGRYDRAAQVSSQALARHDGDVQLLMTYGRAQIGAGHPQEALRPLALVARAEAQNWKARSAMGAALDQVGRYNEARRAYQEALAISPDEPSVLTNLGVSYLMGGQPADAERYLRQAMAAPNAPPEARQNLAIALALQGRFEEAEQMERLDLSPQLAAENMTYLRGLVSDPRRWGDLGRSTRTMR